MENGAIGELFMGSTEPEGIVAADLRQLPLATISALAKSRPDLSDMWMRNETDVDVWADLNRIVPPGRWFKPADVTLDPPTHRGLDDEFLQRVADAYRAALNRGESPNKALAVQVGHVQSTGPKGKPKPYTRNVERWVALARKRGFLAPAVRKGGVA